MQPMTPFALWVWRHPEGLASAYDPAGTGGSDLAGADSATADRQANADLSGYKVEATDGSIGSIDEAGYDGGSAYLVVDTGPWIFGRKVLLPAGTVERIDHGDRKVYVDRTKDQIKGSPEYDEDTFRTPQYRQGVGNYYASNYRDQPVSR